MLRIASRLAEEAREIEKSNDTVQRTPHHSNQTMLKKKGLFEKEQ